MAHYQSEYGRDKTTDEFGNPIRRTEDPVHHGVTEAATGYGTHDTRTEAATGYGTHDTRTGYGTPDTTGTGYGTHSTTGTGYGTHGTTTGGVHSVPLHRSDSSSSSEDDGYGGRRKKGLKEKIKEKLPGGTHRSEDRYGATTAPYGGQHQEKGMMDKIKDKLPGHH